jgi:hypothetical protein
MLQVQFLITQTTKVPRPGNTKGRRVCFPHGCKCFLQVTGHEKKKKRVTKDEKSAKVLAFEIPRGQGSKEKPIGAQSG